MTEADKEWDMEREEKQKAINALKISAPVMAVTQEEFNDYIQTLNQVMDWLEQEPKWIPVSERLPEEDGLYLVYAEEQPFVCRFEDNGFFIDDVLAWMPLPKPYKPQEREV